VNLPLLVRLAARNLIEHKTKTFIIGSIVALGIAVLIIGNSMMDSASRGIEKVYIDNFSGNIVISGKTDTSLSLIGYQSPNKINEGIPTIPEFARVMEFADAHPRIEKTTSQITGKAIISSETGDNLFVFLFGVEPISYRRFFPQSIELLEGEFLEPDQEGILISEYTAHQIQDKQKRPIHIGDSLILSSISNTMGMKVREVTVRGVFRFIHSNQFMDQINFLDIGNLRLLAGLTVASAEAFDLEEAETALFDSENPDSLFGKEMLEEPEGAEIPIGKRLLEPLGNAGAERPPSQVDTGAWHFILIRLKEASAQDAVISDMEAFFEEEDLQAQAVEWSVGAGRMATMAYSFKTVFNLTILIVAVVAVIIIMNTLVISVTERVTEIGTMRALGAQRAVVRRMISLETLLISGIFGAAGILAGSALLAVLNLTGIRADNIFLEILFGGKVLHPTLSAPAIALALVGISAIGVLASLYPAALALRIQPVQAIQKD
jgi:putative ABC transport system permease protein